MISPIVLSYHVGTVNDFNRVFEPVSARANHFCSKKVLQTYRANYEGNMTKWLVQQQTLNNTKHAIKQDD